ncbi:class III lanthipeptide [Staphylococcus hominis]
MDEILKLQKLNQANHTSEDMNSLIDYRTGRIFTWSSLSNHC